MKMIKQAELNQISAALITIPKINLLKIKLLYSQQIMDNTALIISWEIH